MAGQIRPVGLRSGDRGLHTIFATGSAGIGSEGMAEQRRDHRRGHRPPAGADRCARTASAAAALHVPDDRHVSQRRGGLRRRQPAVVRPRLRPEDAVGGRDRAAAARGRRHARGRRRSDRGRARAARPDEGRPAARRARVLRGERARVVGADVSAAPRVPAQRARGRARQAERVRGPRGARVDRAGVPRRDRARSSRASTG